MELNVFELESFFKMDVCGMLRRLEKKIFYKEIECLFVECIVDSK